MIAHTMQVNDFQIRTITGHLITGDATDLSPLCDFIRENGLSDIAKVSFYIHDPEHPDDFINVILRNRTETGAHRFVPEFCTTEPTIQQIHRRLVENVLKFRNLDDQFAQYIVWAATVTEA